MPRRKPYTKVRKHNQLRADHVKGMGDVGFRGFQCLNYQCTGSIFVREDELTEDFSIVCPECGYLHENGAVTRFYDYDRFNDHDNSNSASRSHRAN